MSRLTRARRLSKVVSDEVSRIWRGRRRPAHGACGCPPWFAYDPLESRIMLAAPVIAAVPAQAIDEGKTVTICATFTDADGPCSCAYATCINWGDSPTPTSHALSTCANS